MSRFSNLEYNSEPQKFSLADSKAEEGRDGPFYLRQADEAYRRAQFEQALRYYSRALEFDPNLDQGWAGQVRMLIEQGEYREAELWAEKALEIFRDHGELLAARAVICACQGEGSKALGFSDSSIQQKGNRPYVWLARGEVLLAQKMRNADHCFEKAILLSNTDWFTTLLAGRTYYFYHRPAQGIELARQALELKPANAFIWYVIGNCQRDLGLIAAARKSYQEALTLDRDFRRATDAIVEIDNRKISKRILTFFQGLLHWKRK